MRHVGNRPAHRLVDLALARRIGEVIDTADDVGDAHIVIIDDDGEIIGRVAIGSEDDEIVQFLVLEDDPAHHAILDHGLTVLWCLEPDRRLYARRCQRRIAVTPGSVIANRTFFGFGLFAHLLKLFPAGVVGLKSRG